MLHSNFEFSALLETLDKQDPLCQFLTHEGNSALLQTDEKITKIITFYYKAS